jgi:hypothetical protein
MTNAATKPTLQEAMTKIVGRQLSSVTFVQDYVQFAFDGSGLTAYTPPIVSIESQCFRWGEAGYRDALCQQVSNQIKKVDIAKHSV